MVGRIAGAAGTAPAVVTPAYESFSRASVFACAGVVAALNARAGDLVDLVRLEGLAATVLQLGGISVVIWFALYAALKIGFEDSSERLRAYDLPLLGIVILLTIAPVAIAARGALLLSTFYLFFTSRPGQPDRRLAFILLALGGPLIWGPALLALAPQTILGLDARIVGFLIGTPVRGNVVQSVTGGDAFIIAAGCSSVHNMSLAPLLWTTAAMLFKLRVDRRYVAIGLAMVALMLFLNIARVAAIGAFPQDYEYLHVGVGAALFAWAGLLGLGVLAAIGVLRATPSS